MNRQNQGKSEKNEYIYKKRKKCGAQMKVLKRALEDCMQEEANQVQKNDGTGRTACIFKPFIEKCSLF